jgi:hypothetical protein
MRSNRLHGSDVALKAGAGTKESFVGASRVEIGK